MNITGINIINQQRCINFKQKTPVLTNESINQLKKQLIKEKGVSEALLGFIPVSALLLVKEFLFNENDGAIVKLHKLLKQEYGKNTIPDKVITELQQADVINREREQTYRRSESLFSQPEQFEDIKDLYEELYVKNNNTQREDELFDESYDTVTKEYSEYDSYDIPLAENVKTNNSDIAYYNSIKMESCMDPSSDTSDKIILLNGKTVYLDKLVNSSDSAYDIDNGLDIKAAANIYDTISYIDANRLSAKNKAIKLLSQKYPLEYVIKLINSSVIKTDKGAVFSSNLCEFLREYPEYRSFVVIKNKNENEVVDDVLLENFKYFTDKNGIPVSGIGKILELCRINYTDGVKTCNNDLIKSALSIYKHTGKWGYYENSVLQQQRRYLMKYTQKKFNNLQFVIKNEMKKNATIKEIEDKIYVVPEI